MVNLAKIGEFVLTTKGKIVAGAVTVIAAVAGWAAVTFARVPEFKADIEQRIIDLTGFPSMTTDQAKIWLQRAIDNHMPLDFDPKKALDDLNNAGTTAIFESGISLPSIGVAVAIVVVVGGFFYICVRKARSQ